MISVSVLLLLSKGSRLYSGNNTSLWSNLAIFCLFHQYLGTKMFCLVFLAAVYIQPAAASGPDKSPFCDIPFEQFSEFIGTNFNSNISLSTVLLLLFSMTENPDLLNLHAKQKHPISGETKSTLNGWIIALATAVHAKLDSKVMQLFQQDIKAHYPETNIIKDIATKLDGFSDLLKLSPYKRRRFHSKLQPMSYDEIKGVRLICPLSMICTTAGLECNGRSVHKNTRTRDATKAILIEGTTVHDDVVVLTGKCAKCNTLYTADHESSGLVASRKRLFCNDARFLKVGHNLWVDKVFSASVTNAMYSFHASTSAIAEFWGNSYGKKLTYRNIWATFVQESTRAISNASNIVFEIKDNLPIHDVTEMAYNILGEDGRVFAAVDHECNECSQPYKAKADVIPGQHTDPAALVDNDEGYEVPELANPRTHVVPEVVQNEADNSEHSDDMDIDMAPVKMIVLDGIVMGPTHCAFDNCSAKLKNSRGGALCNFHETEFGSRCRVVDCYERKLKDTQACEAHKEEWRKYTQNHSQSTLSGIRRRLRRPDEINEWQPTFEVNVQPHDEPTPEIKKKNYFGPARFYCVETICAPCGVVIAWTKFMKAESPKNVLDFLDRIYPNEESRPSYICIDKACLILRTAVSGGRWVAWSATSRLIVDSYHYINHRVTDYLCRKWCNPGPADGSAPNLVKVEHDDKGRAYYQRAFNTQVSFFTWIS